MSFRNENVFEIPASVTSIILWNTVGLVVNPYYPVTNLYTPAASPPMICKLHFLDVSALSSTCPYAYVMSNVVKNVLSGLFPTFSAIISMVIHLGCLNWALGIYILQHFCLVPERRTQILRFFPSSP